MWGIVIFQSMKKGLYTDTIPHHNMHFMFAASCYNHYSCVPVSKDGSKKTPQSVNDLGKFDHDLTATEPWNHGLYMGNHPQMALFQISELL
jgi:hypothetical protein